MNQRKPKTRQPETEDAEASQEKTLPAKTAARETRAAGTDDPDAAATENRSQGKRRFFIHFLG